MKSALWTLVLVLALVAPAAAATATTARRSAAPAPPARVLPWIADDWPRALRVARERKLPIFVENWAPW